jgi:hypothetical protein
MSRLDQHILAVRNKLTVGIFLQALARAGAGLGLIIWLVIVVERVLDRLPRHQGTLLWIGIAATVLVVALYSLIRRPSRDVAALAIDQTLGLKEKFSTALFARTSSDPFAVAAVKDAESAAQQVSLEKRFPLQFPAQAWTTAIVFLLALLTALLMPALHLFQKPSVAAAKAANATPNPINQQFAKQELPRIQEGAQLLKDNQVIRKATDDLNKALQTKDGDDLHAKRNALSALQDYNKAVLDELDKNEKFQTAQDEKQELAQIADAKDESSPLGKAQNQLKNGDLDGAMSQVSKAVEDFDKMKPEDQQKAIDQAKIMANELSRAANDPKTGQKIAEHLMQMGATQSQAQEMAAAMQQAANGDSASAKQLQQMAQQMAKQMNNGQGPTSQQQRQIQSLMTKAQGLANSQAQAQALANSTKQLAQAMQQQHQAQQQGHPGQQNKPGQGNQMANAQQAMQQQLQQMQVQAKDAQAMKAAADAAAQAAADAAAGLSPSGGSSGSDQADSGQNGQNPQNSGHAGPNPGHGNADIAGPGGGKMGIAQTPYHTKQEIDPSKDIEGGKMLASRYIKAGIDPGKSNAALRNASAAAEQDTPDEVEQEHIPLEAQQAEKQYFSAMQQDGQ